jgi:hypothetical protein
MQNEKVQVNLGEGVTKAEVIFRETKEVNELPVLAAIPPELSGTIATVYEFLLKRSDQPDQINQKRCHILVGRLNMDIVLIVNENDPYLRGKVVGKLELHPKLKEFGINSNKNWEPNELGQFIKMNRAFFADKTANMALVTQLKNFNATVNTIIQKQKSEKGDFADNYSGIVTGNLPDSFFIDLPIFKGSQVEHIEVEFYASIDGRDVKLQLFSAGANEVIEATRDTIIDEQLNYIKALAPDIAIIEQ